MPAPVGIDREELAVTYAALILHDAEQTITVDGLNAILAAAGVNIPKHWSNLFAKSLEGRSKDDIEGLLSGGSVGAAGAVSAPVAQEAATTAVEEKKDSKPAKKEESEESEGDMGFGLFD